MAKKESQPIEPIEPIENAPAQPSKGVFQTLHAINCDSFTEVKNNGKGNLKYLSWSKAWEIVKTNYPDANYRVVEYDGKPYLFDEFLGYMVTTETTIQGETMRMQLPVMDGANKAMKAMPYSYKTKYGDKYVEGATMFDVNTAIQRCLTKNLAMFGLGLHIYNGEDIPQDIISEDTKDKLRADALNALASALTETEVTNIWKANVSLQKDAIFRNATEQRVNTIRAQQQG